MSTPVFNQVSPQVYALSTLAETQLTNYWAGYFVYSGAGFGASASTTQVWQDTNGFYLFLDAIPNNWAAFTSNLQAVLPNLGPTKQLRLAWISNVNQANQYWQISTGQANATGSGATIAWTLSRAISFITGNFVFSINGQTALTYITDANGGGIGFAGSGSFNGPNGGYTFPNAQIAFSGLTLGTFNGVLAITAPANTTNPDVWSAFNIGLQYAAAPNTLVDETSNSEDPLNITLAYENATQLLFMPVFSRQTAAFSLGIFYDPLNLLQANRTSLNLFPVGVTTPPILGSTLRTTNGYIVKLTPLPTNQAIPAARFTLGACPMLGSDGNGGLSYHFSPDGAFQLSIQAPPGVTATPPFQIMLGLSGIEYTNLDTGNYMLVFQSGCNAFIPMVDPDAATAPNVSQALTNTATTSHLTVMGLTNTVTNPVYFAQPREAPVFSGKNHRVDNILDFNPMPALTIAYNVAQRPPVFPVGFYSGLTTQTSDLARFMENASLAPYRAFCLGLAHGVGSQQMQKLPALAVRRERALNDPLGVTPQGLVAELTPNYQDFDGLIIGNMPNTNYPTVDLTAVTGRFKEALQSNQLFFVASNVTELMGGTSVRYNLVNTPEQKAVLLALQVPQATITAVYASLSGVTQPFNTENDYISCIGTAAGNYLPQFLYVAGILKVEMDGWTFQLSPRSWRTRTDSPTMMIAKFCNRSLLDLANDTSSWAWPQVATPTGGNIKQTQTPLVNLLNAAGAIDASPSLRLFYDTVVTNPNWNGFLFLNAPVDIGEFPDDLKFLTAGIDQTQFYAHHIGFSQTPFHIQSGSPVLEQTAAFGLIDYEDKQDLSADETIPFGFKTMRLRVRFANAALVDFSAEVELMLNQLLGATLSKNEAARGNNLIIDGSYQRVGGTPSYSFTLIGQNVFNANNTVLTQVEILSVQLITGGDTTGVNVLTTFMLMGNFKFILLDPFDLYSFGSNPADPTDDSFLRFSGLSIDMNFSVLTPTQQTFTLRENNTTFDQNAGQPNNQRRNSLLNNFPLTVTSLIASPNLSAQGETPSGQTPEDLGYTSISAELSQTPMIPTWYGLVYTLDLGTFGALTGSQSFKISILAAWSRGASQNDIPVYIGLKLPGIAAIGGSFPLQGVLKLGFRSFQFETYPTETTVGNSTVTTTSYLLRMHRFALSVLVWSFPPGNSDIVLFGQPGNPRGSLGWYAAYSDGKDGTTPTPPTTTGRKIKGKKNSEEPKAPLNTVQRRLKSGRRKPPM